MTRSRSTFVTASLGIAISLASANAAGPQPTQPQPMSQEGTGNTGGAQPMSQEGTGNTSGAQPMSQEGTGGTSGTQLMSPKQVTEAERTQIEAALQMMSSAEMQTAQPAIVSSLNRTIQTQAPSDQKDIQTKSVQDTVDAWNKAHGPATDRAGLEQLLVAIAAAGVPVQQVIIPSIEQVRAAGTGAGMERAVITRHR